MAVANACDARAVAGITVLDAVLGSETPMAGTSPAIMQIKRCWFSAATRRQARAALSPRALEILLASDADTISKVINAMNSVQIALTSGFTPSLISE